MFAWNQLQPGQSLVINARIADRNNAAEAHVVNTANTVVAYIDAEIIPSAESGLLSEGFKLQVLNVRNRMNVPVEYYDGGEDSYNVFYKRNYGTLWKKVERTDGGGGSKKYYYRCNICFTNLCALSTLKFHINTHLGFKPYSCSVCNKCFSSKQNANRCNKAHLKKAARTDT